MWSNAFLYYSRDTEIHENTRNLSDLFEELIKELEDVQIVGQLKAISQQEYSNPKRRVLSSRVKLLLPQYYRGVYEIVMGADGTGERGNSFEFDIELLPNDVCRRLEEYTNDCLSVGQLKPTRKISSSSSESESESESSLHPLEDGDTHSKDSDSPQSPEPQ